MNPLRPDSLAHDLLSALILAATLATLPFLAAIL